MLRSAYVLILTIGLIVILGHGAYAVKAPDGNESSICLQCHSKEGVFMEFMNKETISVFIDPSGFKMSVHGFMECAECHRNYSIDDHPKKEYRSKGQYRLRSSHICRRCHDDEKICEKPIHSALLDQEKDGSSPICSDCHSAHSVMPVTGGKIFMSEKKYCFSCHAYDIRMTYRSGETSSIKVSHETLRSSVHGMLGCSDCHFGFSSEDHPRRNFKSRRDYLIASSDSCRRCHFDKYSKTLESIHHSVLQQGDMTAPSCTDCHGSHGIQRMHDDRVSIPRRCADCHGEIYEVYAKSVHGDALINENNKDVPVCIDCHKAHDIVNPLTMEWHEMIPQICSECHADRSVVEKYGLSVNVVKSYLSDFHGVTLNFYKKQREELDKPARPIAVCTDCHGTHNIMSTRDVGIVKSNLITQCQKCHANITENFPDAWLSHYEPSLASAPLVFVVNGFFKIFIPILVIGLVLQILLHIWRYSSNR
ncbi:MAG: cytochrome c3 family protein [Nitrospirota bacterium]|nr:MAG: cytochrome c3 family protein [Nitrospirota bacterium]